MSSATSEKSKPLVPPDERFWQRYSPHHEFSLSSITSLVIHGLVLGTMLFVGWWLSRSWLDELARPPSMDVVQIEGGGSGSEGWGGGDGLPGKIDPKGGAKQELVEPTPAQKDFKPEVAQPRLKDPVLDPLKVTDVPVSEIGEFTLADLDDVGKAADDTIRKLMDLPKRPPASTSASNRPGPPGKGTGPVGPGIGYGKGSGTGNSGVPGRPVTRQDVLAWRWRFDLAGDGKEHAKKLDAMGVIIGVPDGRGGVVVTRNLKVRPVKLAQDNLQGFKDAVKWYNTKADSLVKLAQELRLPVVPQFVVLLLPKEREDKMAAAEQEYTRRQGKRMEEVAATWFDFRLQAGGYEPVVTKQEYGP